MGDPIGHDNTSEPSSNAGTIYWQTAQDEPAPAQSRTLNNRLIETSQAQQRPLERSRHDLSAINALDQRFDATSGGPNSSFRPHMSLSGNSRIEGRSPVGGFQQGIMSRRRKGNYSQTSQRPPAVSANVQDTFLPESERSYARSTPPLQQSHNRHDFSRYGATGGLQPDDMSQGQRKKCWNSNAFSENFWTPKKPKLYQN